MNVEAYLKFFEHERGVMSNNTYNFKPLRVEILRLYSEFKNICVRHQLRYCAAYGTVLGAIRHKGFIPWDDDFDLFMPRPDYEKFIEVAERELPQYLRVLTYKSERQYNWLWVTVRDMREDLLERIRHESDIDLVGIYIDVFPLDGVPDSWWGVQRFRFINFLLQAAFRSFVKPMSGLFSLSGLKYMCGQFVRLFFPKSYDQKDFLLKIETFYKNLPYDLSTMVGFGYYANLKEGMWRFQRKLIGTPHDVPFENINLPVPEKSEIYLEGCYGNWRQFPPECERRPKHARR